MPLSFKYGLKTALDGSGVAKAEGQLLFGYKDSDVYLYFDKDNSTRLNLRVLKADRAYGDEDGLSIKEKYALKDELKILDTIQTDITNLGTHKHTFTGTSVSSNATPSGSLFTIYQISSVGTLPSHSYTAPSWSASVSNRCLTISWSEGSHSFSAGELPKRSGVVVPKADHKHSVTAAGTIGTPIQ